MRKNAPPCDRALVRFSDVKLQYGQTVVLKVPSFTVAPGDRSALVGQSGSGKTTLLKAIVDDGVSYRGRISVAPELLKPCAVGYVSQSTALVPWWTSYRHILHSRPNPISHAEARELLRSVGLSEAADKYPGELSGGMARRLALGVALAAKPLLLMLDEAMGGVDPFTKSDLVMVVDKYCGESGAALLVVSHDFQEIVSLARKISYINGSGILTEAGFESSVVGEAFGTATTAREAARLHSMMKTVHRREQ